MTGKNEQPWSVTLRPNRSLSAKGFAWVIGIVAALNLVAGVFFWVIGAWPVIGFMGLDVLLIWLALRHNWSRAERFEQIIVDGDRLTLRRANAGEMHFNRRWLRVDLERDEARDLVGRLFLSYRQERHEIGAFLGAEDRLSLAAALRQRIFG